ncbi:MAG: hypothetical protein GXO50_11165 [Chlorobi bacterium]|nr:hypothetical protein [Chlorobiota bacterium]
MKQAQNTYLRLFSIITVFYFIPFISAKSYGQEPVKNGIVNITEFNTDKKIIDLKGKWEFYDNNLYTPSDFKTGKITKPELFSVPGLWNKLKGKGQGFGTYRIKLINTVKNKLYALNINRIQSSYKIWVNDKLIREEGLTGKNKESSKPRWSSSDIIFKADSDTTVITLQVSNFYHKKGGIEHSPVFGEAEIVYEYQWNRSAWNILLLGIFMIMAAYHFAAFLFRRNDKANLYFSLTLIFSAIFSLTVGEILLIDIFPNLNWEILVKTNYISNYLRVLFFALFIYHAFPDELNKNFFKILTAIISFIIIFILVAPALIFTQTLILFLVITGIVLAYLMFGQLKAIKKKRPGAIFSFAGILILAGTAINDILKELQIIDSVSLSIIGVFIFIIFHSYLIMLKNTFMYKVIKRITENINIRSKIKDVLFSAESYDLKAPLKAVSEVIDADRSMIFIYDDNDWTAAAEYLKETQTIKNVSHKVFSGKENLHFSSYNIKKSVSLKEPVFTIINEAVKAKDMTYLEGAGNRIKSIFSYPLVKDDTVKAILYFENFEQKKDFKQRAIEILDGIKPQISVFIDNYASYNELKNINLKLEADVKAKIKEIEARTEELKSLRTKLEEQNIRIHETSLRLEKQTEQINDGINYSEKIQKALIPDKQILQNFLPGSFIYHHTQKKLLTNFYWFNIPDNNEEIVYASVNSHGSDVSAALLSILINQLLNDIVIYNNNYSPKIILNRIQNKFENYPENIGAVEIDIIYYNKTKNEILYSGAGGSLFYVQNNNIILEYKSGEAIEKTNNETEKKGKRFFSNKRIEIKQGTKIFLCSGAVNSDNTEEENISVKKKELISKITKIINDKKENPENFLNNYFSEKQNDILITGITF